MKPKKQMKVKVCLLGEGAVGKTSLIKRFVSEMFDEKYLATLGTKVTKKEMTISNPSHDVGLTMMVWDIMGQKGFRMLLKEAYFYGTNGGIVVCDITRKKTLEDLEEWIGSMFKMTGPIPLVFFANKCDLSNQAEFGEAELAAFAKKYDSPYYMTSAKSGVNVHEAFIKLGELLTRKS